MKPTKTTVVHHPYYYSDPPGHQKPLFFLAGPTKGGGDWQVEALNLLDQNFSESFVVASPYNFRDYRGPRSLPDVSYLENGGSSRIENFHSWEQIHMDLAIGFSHSGNLIFWLPSEDQGRPRSDGLAYALMTRFKLGAYLQKASNCPAARITLGIEKSFPGEEEISKFADLLFQSKGIKIHRTLDGTIQAACSGV